MTPEDLEGYARALRATADAVDAMAASMRAQQAAAARLGMTPPGLTSTERPANVQDVNAVDARRGAAIALSRLDAADAKRAALIKRWKSQARAARALGVSPASLTHYLDGTTPTPRRIARIAEREAGIAPDLWPSLVD